MLWTVFNLLIRSGIILAAAEILRRLLSRSGAGYRHRIVGAAFLLLLSWPLFSALLPEIPVALKIWGPADGMVTVEQSIVSMARKAWEPPVVIWPLATWLIGVVLALAPVAIGYLNVRRLVRQAATLEDESWRELLDEQCLRLHLKTKPRLLIHPQPLIPFTFGLRRPSILLPAKCVQWTLVRRRMVLLHELAHIRRGDLFWQFVSIATTALWWFQPLCWMNRRSLRRESERACDALVLDAGIRPSDYANELLAITRDFGKGQQWSSAAAIAMARRGELEGRLFAILDPLSNSARRFPLVAVAALTALTLTASAVTILPEQNDFQGGHQMRRTLLSSLLLSAGLSAATIGGAVSGPSGVAVSKAAETHSQPSTRAPIRVRGTVAESNLIHKVQPVYPPAAKAARIQGTVELNVTISKEGVPEDLSVIRSPSDDLTQSALTAVRQWRYRPTLLNGEPVEIVTDVIVNYTLSK